MMQVIVIELLLKNKLADASLPIAAVAQRAAIIPTASRRLIRPGLQKTYRSQCHVQPYLM
jgi:hypothetical protein